MRTAILFLTVTLATRACVSPAAPATLSNNPLGDPVMPASDKTVSLSAVSRLPVKEVTAFKDGHAFVVHEGRLPTDTAGQVVLDYLPAPVMGTFWSYATEKNVKLTGVVASQRRVEIERTALTLRELLEANVGAEGFVTEVNGTRYGVTVIGFPTRSSAELAAIGPPNATEALPEKGNVILFKTAEGTKAVGLERIQDVTFKQTHRSTVKQEEFRNLLTLKLDWGGSAPDQTASVGLAYVQKGIRWIPSYKVELDGKGSAVVKLQATVLNEMTDLEAVTLHLVIGVPTFAFKESRDPIALQQTVAQLSQFFQSDAARSTQNSALANNFDNSIMTQAARMGDYRGGSGPTESADPGFPESAKSEDLFVFTLPHVTLKKGERMVLPLAEFTVPYTDVYALEISYAPPGDMFRNLNTRQQADLSRLLLAPKVMHKVRLENNSKYPFTTAPALIFLEKRVLAQGLMTYAASGSSTDLGLTTAVDIQVKKTDRETQRTPNAFSHNGNQYLRVDLDGKIQLTNHRSEPVDVEVTRFALGHIDSAAHDGRIEMANAFEASEYLPTGDYPSWWGWFSWPSWWHNVNSVGRVTWKTRLNAGENVELGYTWHYFWL